MSIDNPFGLLLFLLLLVLGAIVCVYIVIRSIRNLRSGAGQTKKSSQLAGQTGAGPAGQSWFQRLRNWMSEPVSSSGKVPSSPSAVETPPPLAPGRSASAEVLREGTAVEVMRVLRVGVLGEMLIEVEGQRYRRLVEIQDGAIGRRILLAIQELNEFAGGHAGRPMPEIQRAVSPGARPAAGEADLTEEQDRFLTQLQGVEQDDKAEQPKPGLVGYWRRGLSRSERRAAAEAAKQEPKSFVDEIEEMLQVRLGGRPEMDSRSVHFKSTPTGELRIEVDGGFYESIDDVPYPDVRTLLKATIRAWELG